MRSATETRTRKWRIWSSVASLSLLTLTSAGCWTAPPRPTLPGGEPARALEIDMDSWTVPATGDATLPRADLYKILRNRWRWITYADVLKLAGFQLPEEE